MIKYGKGLRIEIIEAILKGELTEPISNNDVKKFCKSKGWNASNNYTSVYLNNASSKTHSQNFVKCFEKTENGKYILKKEYLRRCGYAI